MPVPDQNHNTSPRQVGRLPVLHRRADMFDPMERQGEGLGADTLCQGDELILISSAMNPFPLPLGPITSGRDRRPDRQPHTRHP